MEVWPRNVQLNFRIFLEFADRFIRGAEGVEQRTANDHQDDSGRLPRPMRFSLAGNFSFVRASRISQRQQSSLRVHKTGPSNPLDIPCYSESVEVRNAPHTRSPALRVLCSLTSMAHLSPFERRMCRFPKSYSAVSLGLPENRTRDRPTFL